MAYRVLLCHKIDFANVGFRLPGISCETFGDYCKCPYSGLRQFLCEMDPLQNDGEQYAAKLAEGGVPVEVELYEGVTHEFFGLSGLVNEAA